MRKFSFIIGTLALCAATLQARTISLNEATDIAARFTSKSEARRVKATTPTAAPTLVYTEHEDGEDLFYIFNRPGRGFIIIAADDKAKTVLAYSDTNELTSIDAVPENMRAWLADYARQIKAAKASPAANAPRFAARQEVTPLLTSKWGQEAPYNDECPEINLQGGGNGKSVAGCVATAMAQIMRYYRYPQAPRGDLHYVWNHSDRDFTETVTRHFTGHPYDWDNMLDSYDLSDITAEQKKAVAVLLADAAYSVEMQFSEKSSGAATQLVPFAMATYFAYDASAIYEERGFHDNAEWEGLICDELEARRPVIYTGQTQSGVAHTWIIDGTNGDGMYHINWGWSGFQDGYFALTGANILAPDAGGTGGSETKESFNLSQAAIFGIKPNEGGEPRVDFVSMKEETLSQSAIARPLSPDNATYWFSMYGSFLNHSNRGTDRYCDFGLRFTNTATGESTVLQMPLEAPILMQSLSVLPEIDVAMNDLQLLPAGNYDVEAVFRAFTVQIVGAEMHYIGDSEWSTFRHLHGAPSAQKLTITGAAPDIYLTAAVVNANSAADHLTFKADLHANADIDAYIVPLLFEVVSYDEEGNPAALSANPMDQEVKNTHIVMAAGESKTLWLGEWKYKAETLPQHLILQLTLADHAFGTWDGNNLLQPVYRNQTLFAPTAATAIANVQTERVYARPEVYTISGQRVGTNALKPGIYVIQGKKVVVK